jgi:hypothetical protein
MLFYVVIKGVVIITNIAVSCITYVSMLLEEEEERRRRRKLAWMMNELYYLFLK